MARRAALLAAAVLLCAAAALRPAGAQAFLQEQLPLKPLVTTPSELLTGNANAAVTLQGRQAITVRRVTGPLAEGVVAAAGWGNNSHGNARPVVTHEVLCCLCAACATSASSRQW